MNKFQNRAGDRQTVKSRSAASEFVKQNQTARACVMKYFGGFDHFGHKSRFAAADSVIKPDARKNAVANADNRLLSRNKTADLREQNN